MDFLLVDIGHLKYMLICDGNFIPFKLLFHCNGDVCVVKAVSTSFVFQMKLPPGPLVTTNHL